MVAPDCSNSGVATALRLGPGSCGCQPGRGGRLQASRPVGVRFQGKKRSRSRSGQRPAAVAAAGVEVGGQVGENAALRRVLPRGPA
jgi:hypothetical protein